MIASDSPTAAVVATVRPEGLPERFWDSEKNSIKTDALNEVEAHLAAEASRKATLPTTPEAYELVLPEGLVLPPGVEIKLDKNDPALKKAQAWAHSKSLSQSDFSEALGMIAERDAAVTAAYETAKKTNLDTLGAKGPERIDAGVRWITAFAGTDFNPMPIIATLATTEHVKFLEKVIGAITRPTAPFNASHRVADDGKVSDEAYSKMSFSEKKAYAEKHQGRAA